MSITQNKINKLKKNFAIKTYFALIYFLANVWSLCALTENTSTPNDV